jgi:hypothetical protein
MFERLKAAFSKKESKPSPSERPYAAAFLVSSGIALAAYGRVPAGYYVECGPYIVVELRAPDESLGNAMLQSLEAFPKPPSGRRPRC